MLTCIKLNHLKTNYTLPCAIRVLVYAAAKTVLAPSALVTKITGYYWELHIFSYCTEL